MERADAKAALAWLVASGADEAIADAPNDRLHSIDIAERAPSGPPKGLSESAPIPMTRPTPRTAPITAEPEAPAVVVGTPAASLAARELAQAANTLDELRDAIARFDGLTLKATATNLVFADGNPESPVMLIGEAPGADEDRRGLPFVGVSGQLLDKMLAAIGRGRTNTYITNIVNWRPPGNRKPTPAEMTLSLPFIERHIQLVNPKIVVLLGDTAAKTLTGRTEGITRMRGRWIKLAGNIGVDAGLEAMPTFHPAFLLRSPAQKREAWIDLLAIKARLAEIT